jgi:hypothetical protein
MENEGTTGSVVSMTPRRRKAAPRKVGSAARKPRKTATARKTPARRRAAPAPMSFEAVIKSITGGVSIARAAIAEASGQGAAAVRRAVDGATTASRGTVRRLAREWKAMDPKKKATVLAALLGAAAAATTPLVRKSLKK